MTTKLIGLIGSSFIALGAFAQGFVNANTDHGLFQINVGAISHGAGVSFYDFNKDGFDDITYCQSGDSLVFYESTGDSLIRHELIPNALDMRMASWADYDNDGDADLLVTKARNVGNNTKLYRNDGWPVLTDVTPDLAMPNFGGVRSYGHCWGDYDKDGFLDLYICNYNLGGGITNWLFHNDGDGTFTELSAAAGVANGSQLSFQSVFWDFNQDGWLDLYVVNDLNQQSVMYYNNGDGTFNDVSVATGTNIQIEAMCISIFDYQNDGDWDIYVTNIAVGNFLLVNENGVFSNQADVAGLELNRMSWGSTFVDFDNDTDQDIHIVTTQGSNNQNPFLENNGNDFFTENNALGFEGDITNAYSNAKGDYNNDGFYDLTHSTVGSQNSYIFWENLGIGGNWVKVDLTGTYSNRDAIGSHVSYWINGVERRYFTSAGGGFLSQNAHTEILGLSDATQIDSLTITWPRGFVETHYDLQAGQRYDFIEGQTLSASIEVLEETTVLCDSLHLNAGQWSSYLWDNGSTDATRTVFSSGEYTVVVTNEQGISTSASISITQGYIPQITAEVINNSCYQAGNGNIAITESNNQPYTAVWNTESGALPQIFLAGVYSAVITSQDNCSIEVSYEITEPGPFEASAEVSLPLCAGETGAATINFIGGAEPITTDWQGFDPDALAVGDYFITSTDNNECLVISYILITAPEELVIVNSTITDAENGNNGAIELEISGGVEPYNFAWSNSTSENPIIDIGQGQYSCLITDANGCEISFEGAIIDLNVNERENSFRIFPNPSSGIVQIESTISGASIRVIDGFGRIIWNNIVNNSRIELDLSAHAKGMYIIEVIAGSEVERHQMIIE